MSYIILYFSGTGNSELLAKEITKRLEAKGEGVELLSIENKKELALLDFNGKTIGFGYPIYKFTYPDIFHSVLPLINQLVETNPYFQFSSYARFPSNSFFDFSEQLDSDKFNLIAQKAFKSPSCGISSRKEMDDYEYKSVMFFEDDMHNKLDSFVESIRLANSIHPKKSMSLFDQQKKKLVKNIEITKYPHLSIQYTTCISCGICVKNCPSNNLKRNANIDNVRIVDSVNCLHCLRCMHHCPVNAISFGPLTKGNKQYTFATRDALYQKNLTGYTSPYWKNFNKVIRKWRSRTIRYWLIQKIKHIL